MINLGGNQLIPVTNAVFDGQIVGEQEQFLPYPPGDTPNYLVSCNDNALDCIKRPR